MPQRHRPDEYAVEGVDYTDWSDSDSDSASGVSDDSNAQAAGPALEQASLLLLLLPSRTCFIVCAACSLLTWPPSVPHDRMRPARPEVDEEVLINAHTQLCKQV